MTTIAANKTGIDGGKVLRWTARFVWATTVFLVKITFIFATIFVGFILNWLHRSEEQIAADDAEAERQRREDEDYQCMLDTQRRRQY